MISGPRSLPQTLRILSDTTRLRILGILDTEEVSVGELCRSLGLAQSRVSNHLRVLRHERFLLERHVGASTYLRLADASALDVTKARLWEALREELPSLPQREADLTRLREVLAERRAQSREFFDRMAGRWDKIGIDFASGQARERAVASLLGPGLVIADLGCGTGFMARALLGLAARLVLVDGSPGMLEEARARLGPLPSGSEVELRQGELDRLPFADRELDGAVCGMVLHHLPELGPPLVEMRRVLKPGASAVVLELAPHHETWMHEAFGDRHLGLDPADVCTAFARAGFVDVRLETVDDRYRPKRTDGAADAEAASLSLYIVRGRRPADDRPEPRTQDSRS